MKLERGQKIKAYNGHTYTILERIGRTTAYRVLNEKGLIEVHWASELILPEDQD